MAAERTLTTRELNRALLARQFLLQPSSHSVVDTIERIGGLQTQYAPSGYIGIWSRMKAFRRNDLTTALEHRRIIQGTLLRNTIHMVSPRDYWLFLAGTRASRQEWFRRITKKEYGELPMDAAAAALREHLPTGPRRADELKQALLVRGFEQISWAGLSGWLDMVRVPPSGTWEQRRADLFALAEHWTRPVACSEAQGLQHILTRYLAAFGPALLRDAADWAGIPPTRLVLIAERISLRRFRDEQGRELFDLPRAPLPDPSTPAPVRFLPTWDATLLVHARRTQILPERFRPLVFNTKTPHSRPTFLVDGQVAGAWRYEGKRIIIESFDPLPARARRAVDVEAQRLAAFHGD
ncbi:MAG: winged helix DNA-binding domain-containing protein [Chloroflexi bacterium]|nr:MAG: winged helix DNA-binding domain-containing protein [Chloroflexota bacterium]